MPRPQIVVNVTTALPRRGAGSLTGVAFVVYAGAAGSTQPVRCVSATAAADTGAPAPVVQHVTDVLANGAPAVVLLRAAAADPAAITEGEWSAALALLAADFGPGQVLIPGVTDAAADVALLAHAAAVPTRCVLLDAAADATAVSLTTRAAALAAAPGSNRATIVTPANLPGAAPGATRVVPGSVIAAGLAARGDAYAGHANNAPTYDQGRGAGFVPGATGVPTNYTDAEQDALYDAGVSVIGNLRGQVQLTGWRSLSTDARFRQLNWGRFAMQLSSGVAIGVSAFLGRQIDGKGLLFAELDGFLRGYLLPFWSSSPEPALWGTTAQEAFDVEVGAVNTPETIAAGELHAAVAVSLSPSTEKVVVDVLIQIAQGVAA